MAHSLLTGARSVCLYCSLDFRDCRRKSLQRTKHSVECSNALRTRHGHCFYLESILRPQVVVIGDDSVKDEEEEAAYAIYSIEIMFLSVVTPTTRSFVTVPKVKIAIREEEVTE